MSLDGKRVVVIGGTGGFGFATAQAAARAGAQVVVGSSSTEKVEAALAKLGAGAEGAAVDIADAGSLERFLDRAGRFDHLVTAVGDVLPRMDFRTTPAEQAKTAFNVRLWGQYDAARLAAPGINEGGSITLTSGTSSQRAIPGFVLGGAVCAAVEGLGRQLSLELAPIRVNVVAAGIVQTSLWDRIPEDQREGFFAAAGQRLPVRRVGQPADIAQAYLYLMQNGFSTGTTLFIDGGALATGA